MPKILKGLVTPLITGLFSAVTFMLIDVLFGKPVALLNAFCVGGIAGAAYGIQAGILLIYDLNRPVGWIQILIDSTWSLVNTLFGFVFGNAIYLFFGWPTRNSSENQGWISYVPRGTGSFGHSVLQTLGTVNLGGAGAHERVHLLQARIFGPLYLPIFGANYCVNFVIQVLWTFSLGGLLWITKCRQTPYFTPPTSSAVGGFFGWIYYANLFELWAYHTP